MVRYLVWLYVRWILFWFYNSIELLLVFSSSPPLSSSSSSSSLLSTTAALAAVYTCVVRSNLINFAHQHIQLHILYSQCLGLETICVRCCVKRYILHQSHITIRSVDVRCVRICLQILFVYIFDIVSQSRYVHFIAIRKLSMYVYIYIVVLFLCQMLILIIYKCQNATYIMWNPPRIATSNDCRFRTNNIRFSLFIRIFSPCSLHPCIICSIRLTPHFKVTPSASHQHTDTKLSFVFIFSPKRIHVTVLTLNSNPYYSHIKDIKSSGLACFFSFSLCT